jgi:hypothetical protein
VTPRTELQRITVKLSKAIRGFRRCEATLPYLSSIRPREGRNMGDTAWIFEIIATIESKDGDRVAAAFSEDGFYEVPSLRLRVSGRPAIAKF